jgi:ribosomal protein L11 methyltransferase
MIRLAVRCAPEQAELVLAELTVLAPNGVEEDEGPGYVEYAIYGGEGELPELGDLDAAVGSGMVEVSATEVPDDWADRWRDFHKPLLVGERIWLRPSWEQPREGTIDLLVDPGQAFGTGAHPTTRLCLEYLLGLEDKGEAQGPLTDLGTGSGVLAIAAAKLGWRPVSGYDHEQPAIEAAAANATANGVELSLEHMNLREQLPPLAPTVVANMTAPVLREVANLMTDRGSRGGGGGGRPHGSHHTYLLRPPPSRAGRRCVGLRPRRPCRGRSPPGGRLGGAAAASSLRDIFPPMLATIVDADYKIALFLHILAVVLAFGPTFGYALFFSVAPQHPRATPAILAGVQKCDRYLVNPGMVVLLLAGIGLLIAGDGAWETSDVFVSFGIIAIIVLFGLQHAFFQPQVRKAKELAERDLKAGDALSPEFEALGQRIGQVGTLAGVIVVVTVFFMTYKPFL